MKKKDFSEDTDNVLRKTTDEKTPIVEKSNEKVLKVEKNEGKLPSIFSQIKTVSVENPTISETATPLPLTSTGAEDALTEKTKSLNFGKNDNGKQEHVLTDSGAMENARAKNAISAIDILWAKLCGAVSGVNDKGMWRMEKEEKEEFTELAEVWVSEGGWMPSAKVLCFLAFLFYLGSSLAMAYGMRKNNGKTVARKRDTEIETLKKEEEKAEIVKEEKKFDYSGTKEFSDERGKFNIDKKGFYTNDKNGKYIKVEERSEKPSKEVLLLIKKELDNLQIKKIIQG